MRRVILLALIAIPSAAYALPVIADAADSAIPGSGAGVWAMAGAFFGQIAATRIVRSVVNQHEARCRAYAPPFHSPPE